MSGAGSLVAWCYECGAVRRNHERWVKPVGPGGENPAVNMTLGKKVRT